MRSICFIFLSIFLVCILSACGTMKKTQSDDENQRARTAKINAQLGIAYLERHDVQRAKQKLLLSLSEDSDIPEPWYSMAYFQEATGNKIEANKYYLKAVEIAPGRGDAQNNYGTFLCRAGNYSDAIKHFKLAIADPNYLDPADASENAGLCAMKIPDDQLAMTFFNQALLQDMSRPTSLIKLAEIQYRHKHLAEAKESLQRFSMLSKPTAESQHLVAQLEM